MLSEEISVFFKLFLLLFNCFFIEVFFVEFRHIQILSVKVKFERNMFLDCVVEQPVQTHEQVDEVVKLTILEFPNSLKHHWKYRTT